MRPDGPCWVNLRLVRMKQRLAGRYPEFIVFRRIDADHRAVFMEELRNRLINGLAIPYMILDLIDLRAGSFYSSRDNQGLFAEHFNRDRKLQRRAGPLRGKQRVQLRGQKRDTFQFQRGAHD